MHSHRNAVNMPNNIVKKSNDEVSFVGENSSIFVQQNDDTHPMTPNTVDDSALRYDSLTDLLISYSLMSYSIRTNTLPALLTPLSSPSRDVEADSMNTPLDIKRQMSPFRDHGSTTPTPVFIKPLKLPSFTESNHTLMIGAVQDTSTVRSNKYCVIS